METIIGLAKTFYSAIKRDKFDSVPKNILAFRTISSMLAYLPRTAKTIIQAVDFIGRIADIEDRQEVKISDALAHLAAGQHDITALATDRKASITNLHVVAVSDDLESPLLNAQPEDPPTKTYGFMFTRNPSNSFRKEEAHNVLNHPDIVSPSPPDPNVTDAYAYMLQLEKNWVEPSMATHLWILAGVLNKAIRDGKSDCFAPPVIHSHLSLYIAAWSHKRIYRRLKHESLSMPYIQCLKDVDVKSLTMKDPPETPDLAELDEPALKRAKHEEALATESDQLFLDFLVTHYGKRPKSFGSPIRSLLALAKQKHSDGKPFRLYTPDTCQEFHLVILRLLDLYWTTLAALDKLRLKTLQISPAERTLRFRQGVDDLYRYGYALLRLARGRAYRTHLETIQDLLKDPRPPVEVFEDEEDVDIDAHPSDNPNPKDDLDEGPPENFSAEMAEVHSPLPEKGTSGVQNALANSYVAWMRLMVAHFDSGEIVMEYLCSDTFKYDSLSIDILIAPPTDGSLLPWAKVIADPKYFPAADPANPDVTNDEIIDFLKTKASAVKIKAAELRKTTVGPIMLPPDERFYNLLNKSEFTGTLHCEACLATLLPAFTGDHDHPDLDAVYQGIAIMHRMKNFGSVVGVSKRCCPACAAFLRLLSEHRKKPIVVRGSHPTITACTLPLWTPSEIVDSMNITFGRMLRTDLVELIKQTNAEAHWRDRVNSSGSDKQSVGGQREGGWQTRFRPIFALKKIIGYETDGDETDEDETDEDETEED